MKYAIYSLLGEILRITSCPESQIEANVRSGEQCITCDSDVRDTTHYVSDGACVAMPTRPSEHHVFDYTTKQWIDPRTLDDLWAAVRVQRNALLAASDWTQLPDVPGATQSAWTSYRQALRDITNQPDPSNVTWPTEPI